MFSIGMLLYHSLFQIKTVSVYGSIRLSSEDLKDTVHGVLSGKKFLLPASNFFLVDESEVEDLLLEKYPLESVEATKVFPNALKVDIQEKITKVLYTDGERVQFVDQDGSSIESLRKVFESEWGSTSVSEISHVDGVETTTVKLVKTFRPDVQSLKSDYGDYPIVYSADALVLTPAEIQDALSWFRLIHKMGQVEYHYQTVHEGISYGSLVVSGVPIYISSRLPQEIQQNLLAHFLSQQNSGIQEYEYIDLRYAPAIYWK